MVCEVGLFRAYVSPLRFFFQSRERKFFQKMSSKTLIFANKINGNFPTLFILHQSPYFLTSSYSISFSKNTVS